MGKSKTENFKEMVSEKKQKVEKLSGMRLKTWKLNRFWMLEKCPR